VSTMKDLVLLDHDAWIERRRTSIGASDVPAILGESPFRTPLSVWAHKRGLLSEAEQRDMPEAVEWGLRLEPVVFEKFRTGSLDPRLRDRCVKVSHGMIPHPTLPHHASPDGVILAADGTTIMVGVEVKTTSEYKRGEWDDGVPRPVLLQALWQMHCMAVDRIYVPALIGGNTYMLRDVERDEDELRATVERVEEWRMRYLVGDEKPEPIGGEGEDGTLRRMFPRSKGNLLPATTEALILRDERNEAVAAMAEVARTVEAKENALKLLIGDADGIEGVVTWKSSKDATVLDAKAYTEHLEALAAAAGVNVEERRARFLTTRHGTRRFLIKKGA